MLRYTLLAVVAVCSLQIISAQGYGAGYDNAPPAGYQPPVHGGPHYPPPDFGHGEDHHEKKCKSPKRLHIHGVETSRVSINDIEKDGKFYTAISCPNDGNPYAIVAEKHGKDISVAGTQVKNVVLLTTGHNVEFVGKCKNGKRFTGKSVEGHKETIKKVACVRLSNPMLSSTL